MNRGGQPPPQSKNRIPTKQKKKLKLTANSQKTAPDKMKLFKMTFAALGILAAIAITLGAYWHIFTLGACALIVWSIKGEEKRQNN